MPKSQPAALDPAWSAPDWRNFFLACRVAARRRHHGRVEWRLAPLTAIGAADLDQVQIVSDQAQYKAGEMALDHKILHPRGQKQRLIDLPGAECLAHAAGENLTCASLASKIRYYLDRLLGADYRPRTAGE